MTWFLRATATSATGLQARDVDWGATPLGDPGGWPPELRTAVEMCLATRFPVLVTWGPELTMIYNDGYRDMLGSQKHPAALGAPLRQVWAEVWDDIAPSVRRVVEDGESTWEEDARLVVRRSGYDEETYFTYSYSPLRDATDTVRGLLDIATETTSRVVERRRGELLSGLAARLGGSQGDEPGLVARVAALLEDACDVAAAELHLVDDASGGLVRRAAVGPPVALPAGTLARVASTGAPEECGATVALPLAAAGDPVPSGVLVLAARPGRPWDDAFRRFFGLVATGVGAVVSGGRRYAREVGQLREVSDVLQAAMLPEGSALPGVVGRYVPASGELAVGGDWYDLVELGAGRQALVVGDCVGHGLDAAARMGQLRSAARALLLEQGRPLAVLDGLDRFAATLPGAECTTVFCGVVDRTAGTLTYAVAGHLPPVVRHPDGTTDWLTAAGGASLGIAHRPRVEATATLGAGDVVVLYTDGLVERRGEPLARGLGRLAAQDADAPAGRVADALLAGMVPDGGADDIAIVVYRADGAARG